MIGKNGIASVYMNDNLKGSATGGDINNQWFQEIRAHTKTKKTLSLSMNINSKQ